MSFYRWKRNGAGWLAGLGVVMAGVLVSPSAHAVPQSLTVQGFLAANGGTPVTGDYTITLALYTSSTSPTPLWEESQVVTVVGGIFDARLGADLLNPLTVDDFADNEQIWLGITVDAGPGVPVGGESELPRRRLSSTGFAFAAGSAEVAETAAHATTADTATSATTANSATTAGSAGALSCTGCLQVSHLGFDPATQTELQAALAALDIPTTIDGLGGGTIGGNVTVSGSLTASSLVLPGGRTVCDSSGNCGATLGGLTCVAPNDTPVYDHTTSAWKCGTGSASSGVNASDLSCSGCVSEAELSFDPVTAGELTTALGGYATTAALSGYATTATLADYATNASLSSYATTASLASYATTASLSGYVTTGALDSALGSYATVASLASYVTSSALTTTLNQFVTASALDTRLADYAELGDLAQYALASAIPTSLNGLNGGTVSGDVSSTGTLEGAVVKQNGNVVCDASGNCGQTLGSLTCTAGQTVRYDDATNKWVCGSASSGGGGTDPGMACIGDYKVLQWDGDGWVCRDLRKTGLSQGGANGWEIVDEWGDAWDAIERPPLPWQSALDACVAEGGRLPTVTELWRNRASAGGTGNFADAFQTHALWAYNPDSVEGSFDTVRVSDGTVGSAAGTSATINFRCIWPKHQSNAFDGAKCFGPPGAECGPRDFAFNIDRYSRPAVDATSAAWECRFNHASMMTYRSWSEYVRKDLENNPANEWHWLADEITYHDGNDYYGVARTAAGANPHWSFDAGTEGTVSGEASARRFRCVGKKSTTIGVAGEPQCLGGTCFTLTRRSTTLRADTQNRAATTHIAATQACEAIGGRLPSTGEALDLIQAGWIGPEVATWHWTSEVNVFRSTGSVYNYARGLVNWGGVGSQHFHMDTATFSYSNYTGSYVYRCVWGDRLEDEITVCEPNESQNWNGTASTCSASVDGNAAGRSWPTGFPAYKDAWGNEWDFQQRTSTLTYQAASDLCAGLGARLPTVSELWRVRFGQTVVATSLGTSSDTAALWTMTPSYGTDQNLSMKLSDGVVASVTTTGTTALNVRCIWPATKGNILSGRSCYGDPEDDASEGCFTDVASGLRIDEYDRAAVYHASAANECAEVGGRLPTLQELETLIHRGAPNGGDAYLHLASPGYWYNGNYGTESARWRPTDGNTWAWSLSYVAGGYQTASLAAESTLHRFRCVYSNEIAQ